MHAALNRHPHLAIVSINLLPTLPVTHLSFVTLSLTTTSARMAPSEVSIGGGFTPKTWRREKGSSSRARPCHRLDKKLKVVRGRARASCSHRDRCHSRNTLVAGVVLSLDLITERPFWPTVSVLLVRLTAGCVRDDHDVGAAFRCGTTCVLGGTELFFEVSESDG